MTRPEKGTVMCRGCGTPVDAECPIPDHCGSCPPWICDGCDEPCSMGDPCACWVSMEGMALADIKALLSLGDLALTHTLPLADHGDEDA